MAYFTADIPETMPSFFVMFLLIAASRGARSAATKLEASELVSMPEPAPRVLVMFAAAFFAVVAAVALAVPLDEVDVTAVTMVYFESFKAALGLQYALA
jgi:hypothetical protein